MGMTRKSWAEFVAQLDAGVTRAHLRHELTAAAIAGDTVHIEHALQIGALLNAADEYGRTAVFLAAQAGHAGSVALLAKSRADLNQAANGGCTPLMVAAAKHHEAVIDILKDAKVDMNALG